MSTRMIREYQWEIDTLKRNKEMLESRLAKAQGLVEKWRGYKMPEVNECEKWMTKVAYDCADELEKTLGDE